MNDFTKSHISRTSMANIFSSFEPQRMGIGIINKTKPVDSGIISPSDIQLKKRKIKVLPDDILMSVLVRNLNTPNFNQLSH